MKFKPEPRICKAWELIKELEQEEAIEKKQQEVIEKHLIK